jgi:DNA-binding MarR family transcriptional regulator
MSSTASQRTRVGYLIKGAQHALRTRMDDRLREFDLTTGQFALMIALREVPGASNADLARRCFITPQSVSGLTVGLLGLGLIKRAASRTHGRIIEIRLTADGRARLLKAEAVLTKEVEERMLSGLDSSERRLLASFLRICIKNLSDADEGT